MECEMCNCHEQAVERVPILGIMRHVCEQHARDPYSSTQATDTVTRTSSTERSVGALPERPF